MSSEWGNVQGVKHPVQGQDVRGQNIKGANVHALDVSPPKHFALWTFRHQDVSPPSVDFSPPLVSCNFRNLLVDLSLMTKQPKIIVLVRIKRVVIIFVFIFIPRHHTDARLIAILSVHPSVTFQCSMEAA